MGFPLCSFRYLWLYAAFEQVERNGEGGPLAKANVLDGVVEVRTDRRIFYAVERDILNDSLETMGGHSPFSLFHLTRSHQMVVVTLQGVDKLVDPLPILGHGCQYGYLPAASRKLSSILQHRFQFANSPVGVRSIGFVDHVNIGDLQNSGLYRLDVVSHPGRADHHGGVASADDVDLVLSDTNSLHQHHVLARGIQYGHGIGRGPSEPAERAAGGHRANIHVGVVVQLPHPDPITEYGTSRKWARRVDRNDAHGIVTGAQLAHERGQQRALPGTGWAGDADDPSIPTEPVKLGHLLDHAVGPRLDARDHPGNRRHVARAHPLDQALRRIYASSHVRTPLAQSARGVIGRSLRDRGQPSLPYSRPASDPRPSFLHKAAYGFDDRIRRRVLTQNFGDSHLLQFLDVLVGHHSTPE